VGQFEARGVQCDVKALLTWNQRPV
jgi:hypothetical protein